MIGKNTSSNMAACHGQYCKLAKTLIPGQTSHAFHFIKNLSGAVQSTAHFPHSQCHAA